MTYKKGFSTTSMFIAIGILVVVAVVGIVVQKKNINQRVQEAAKQVSTVAEATPRVQPSSTQKVVTASDTTDTKLDKDFSDIDTSLNVINSDAASIDTGLNDQIGDLSE